MAKYKCTAGVSAWVRTGPGVGYKKISYIKHNQVVTSNSSPKGNWLKIDSPAGYTTMQYLEKISSPPKAMPTSAPVESDFEYVPASDSNLSYKELYYKYLTAFGCPPKFTDEVDNSIADDIPDGLGRVYSKYLLSNPTLLSICPGKVSYLPKFNTEQKNYFFERIRDEVSDDSSLRRKINSDKADRLNGKLFSFTQAYKEYIKYVNVLCRSAALFLGIGEEYMPGTHVELKEYDYSWYSTTRRSSGGRGRGNSIFSDIRNSFSSVVTDDTYIHFFITQQGTDVSENISTDTTSSGLENIFNNSGLDSVAKNLQFMFGGTMGDGPSDDMQKIIEDAEKKSSSNGILSTFAGMASNVLKGSHLVFPKMLDSSTYDKSISCSTKFVSPYGDKMSIFLRCFVPALHLLAFSLPKQTSVNMYTYPFLVRVNQKGWYNSDLAVITDLRLTKGGSDDTCWTIDSLPTEIDVSFSITPLHNNLMVSSSDHPFMFMRNTSMLEYLGTMCGLDLKSDNLGEKLDVAIAMARNKFTDLPKNLSQSILNTWTYNTLQNFLFINN